MNKYEFECAQKLWSCIKKYYGPNYRKNQIIRKNIFFNSMSDSEFEIGLKILEAELLIEFSEELNVHVLAEIAADALKVNCNDFQSAYLFAIASVK